MTFQTVPICRQCWDDNFAPKFPARKVEPEIETCYMCLQLTMSGIYIRIEETIKHEGGDDNGND